MSRKRNPSARAPGPVAKHCATLLACKTPEFDELGAFSAFAEQLGMCLGREWAQIGGGNSPQVEIGTAHGDNAAAFDKAVGPLAGNLLFTVGNPGVRMLASFAVAPLFDELDRMFGGGGGKAAEAAKMTALPRSVELMLRKLEQALGAALGNCLAPEHGETVGKARLGHSLQALAPFPENADITHVELTFGCAGSTPLSLRLACRTASLPRLLDLTAKQPRGERRQREHIDTPFTDIPLTLRAKLVDMTMPMRRLAALEVGAVLPVTVARSVPLMVGEQTIATGTIGELDDRIALRIDQRLIEETAR